MKKKKIFLLIDDGYVHDIDGEKLEFHPSGEIIEGKSYKFFQEPFLMSREEKVTHILFNTPPPQTMSKANEAKSEEKPSTVSLLWQSNWCVFDYEQSTLHHLDILQVTFQMMHSKLEVIPLRTRIYVRKTGSSQKFSMFTCS